MQKFIIQKMPGKRPYKAVLHVKSKDFNGVNSLAKSLLENYFAKAAMFPNGVAKLAQFTTEAGTLDTLITNSKGNSAIKLQRDAQSVVVLKLIVKVQSDINDTADGDINILTESGMDTNYQPEAQGEPELSNSIKGFVDGTVEGSEKK